MQLTDMDTVLAVAREGVKEAEKDRKERFSRSYGISAAREAELMVAETAPADAISVIGGPMALHPSSLQVKWALEKMII